jgi:hypothetical protein
MRHSRYHRSRPGGTLFVTKDPSVVGAANSPVAPRGAHLTTGSSADDNRGLSALVVGRLILKRRRQGTRCKSGTVPAAVTGW